MAPSRPQNYNAFGRLLHGMMQDRGLCQAEAARLMVARGWPIGNPQHALSNAMRKRSANMDMRLVRYLELALKLSRVERNELIWAAYDAALETPWDTAASDKARDRVNSSTHVS